MVAKIEMVFTFLKLSPLLVTSAIANFGTLSLCIALEREFALIYIGGVLLSNLLVVLLPTSVITSTLTCMGMAATLPPPEVIERNQHALFMTWTNLFLMSKTLEDPCLQRSGQMILMQWLRFVVNLVTLGFLFTHLLDIEPSLAMSNHIAPTINAMTSANDMRTTKVISTFITTTWGLNISTTIELCLLTVLISNALNLIVIVVVYCRCSSKQPVHSPAVQHDELEDDAEEVKAKRVQGYNYLTA